MQSPRAIALKRLMAQVLEGKYVTYDDLLNRIAFFLVTENDVQSFGKMIGEVYERGYMRAVDDHKEQLQKLGIKISINQKNLADSP